MTDQVLSPQGAAFIRHSEGFVDHWYLDPVNVPTIGIGFTWRSAAFRAWWAKNRPGQAFVKGAKMSRAEADQALIEVVGAEYGAAVVKFLGKKVPQHVFDAMCSVVYNLGPGSLKWKWAAAVKASDLQKAGTLLRTTGTTASGKKLPGLVTRRREESELLVFGDYTTGKVYAEPVLASGDGLLIKGARGDQVIELQKLLAAQGFYKGAVDGIFGRGTEAAVLAFQRAKGLDADGKVGAKTWAALRPNVLNAAFVNTTDPVVASDGVELQTIAHPESVVVPASVAAPVKGPITDLFKGILAQWILRRVLEVGGVTTTLWAIVSNLSTVQQQAIMDLLSGNFDKVSVGVIVGLALYLGTQIWSLISTIRPQVVADGKQVPTTPEAARVAKVTAQTVEAKSLVSQE